MGGNYNNRHRGAIGLKKKGENPKVLYEVTDFHNPTGEYMPLEKREQLIQLAETYNFLIMEDNPYRYFRYDTEKIPTLKALDTCRRVIYPGSFSRRLFPGFTVNLCPGGGRLKEKKRQLFCRN